ncbi:MAG TPA: hypothetical protein VF787_03385 [Thermoanaerobaculia bacterium]
MPEFPAEFPGAWQNLPIEVRRFLTAKLLDRALAIHEGSEGLIKWLYAGTSRLDGKKSSETYALRGSEFWPVIVADTQVWIAQRAQPSPGKPE